MGVGSREYSNEINSRALQGLGHRQSISWLEGEFEAVEDDFSLFEFLKFKFQRDEQGIITGFVLFAGRVTGLHFEKN